MRDKNRSSWVITTKTRIRPLTPEANVSCQRTT